MASLVEELITVLEEEEKIYRQLIGYGQQKTGGYSIAVDELYLTEDAIYVGTTLLGPEITGQKKGAEKPSTPYIVIKTEFLDKTVIYE